MEAVKQMLHFKDHDAMGKVFSKYLDPVTMEKSELVTVTTDTSAMECLKLIREHKFLCLPVMNPHHEDRIVGLIDVMDLAAYVVTLYDRTKGTEKEVGSYFNFDNVFQRFLEGRRASDLMSMLASDV
jgi:CBS-domain-containing membrane protein